MKHLSAITCVALCLALAGVPGVTQVLARPPSAYVSIDQSAWDDLDDSERKALVAKIGQTAEKAGYQGVLVRTAQGGSAVAHWLKQEGVRLSE